MSWIDTLVDYDTQVFLFLNKLGSENWDGLWLFITHKFSSIPLYAFLLYLVYRKMGAKGTLIVMIFAALLITASDQLANLFKYGIQRPRPCKVESLQETMRFVAHGCGRFGYFSAHASSSMAAAVYLGLIFKNTYKYLPFILLFWAFIVAYSRIYVGVHYPLDIITGMAIGGLLGYIFFRLQKIAQKNYGPKAIQ